MDDSRIQQLRQEVLGQLRSGSGGSTPDLEARVAALEAAVAEMLRARAAPAPVTAARAHPSLRVIGPASGSERCIMEPDRPCVASHACRVLGH